MKAGCDWHHVIPADFVADLIDQHESSGTTWVVLITDMSRGKVRMTDRHSPI